MTMTKKEIENTVTRKVCTIFIGSMFIVVVGCGVALIFTTTGINMYIAVIQMAAFICAMIAAIGAPDTPCEKCGQ